MHQPMAGITVVEVAMYGFVSSAGAVLADWGADVLKVEHAVTGDPQRGLRRTGSFVVEGDLNPNVEHPNRGSRLTCAGRPRSPSTPTTCSSAWLRLGPDHRPQGRRRRHLRSGTGDGPEVASGQSPASWLRSPATSM
jgi:hypothetical protein